MRAHEQGPNPQDRMIDVPEDLPLATRLWCEAAQMLGYTWEVLDPEFGYLFEVRGAGRVRRFLGGRSPLNDAVAARLAEDKHYTGLLLGKAGLRVAETVRCISPRGPRLTAYRDLAGPAPGEALAKKLGFPLVVKPNRLSHGRGVRLVTDEAELAEALDAAWDLDAIALVQEPLRGRDVRLDFLDGELLAGYERRPLEVVGDGERTLASLAADFDPRFAEPDRLPRDTRLMKQLDGRGLDWVVPAGETFRASATILNLNGAATAEIVRAIEPPLRDACAAAGAALGLRHYGVDLKLGPDSEPAFIEVNASPLLLQMYKLGWRDEAREAQRRVLAAAFEADT